MLALKLSDIQMFIMKYHFEKVFEAKSFLLTLVLIWHLEFSF